MNFMVKRGDIFYADLSPVVGSEQGKTRPYQGLGNPRRASAHAGQKAT